ncbi:recombinase family protein [Actinomadura rubrisoli]|nr:recombinase family protein [Actinomadura rubrisoli]
MGVTERDMIPVVSYARISADQERDEHGIQHQHKVNRQTAERLGWIVVDEFTDNDKSAAKSGVVRDEFETMVRALRTGKLQDGRAIRGTVVMVEDRLVRRPGDYERFVEALTYREGRVYADQRGPKDLYSEDVESMGLIGAVIAKMEVRKMQRRMRNDHRRRALAGEPPAGGNRPFGWKDDRRTLDRDEATLVAKAAEQYVSGRGLNSIVRAWQEAGIKTTTGREWTTTSLKVLLRNPRLCGWRMINGELVRGPDGQPIVGQWDAIITPEQWMAVNAIFTARKGHLVNGSGSTSPLPQDFREHKHLLTSFLRCGRIRPDGTMCGARLRVTRQRDCVQHIYSCPPKSSGGCGGLGRRGDKVDEFISEAVLAKLEERSTAAQDVGPWPGEEDLKAVEDQIKELREQWRTRKISNALFFEEIPALESEQTRLRAERERYALTAQRAAADMTDIRRRWYSEDDEDRLDISQKRAYIREALHAVIIHPVGKGNGSRTKFNPDLLEPFWRED